jgi:hypothetical protein
MTVCGQGLAEEEEREKRRKKSRTITMKAKWMRYREMKKRKNKKKQEGQREFGGKTVKKIAEKLKTAKKTGRQYSIKTKAFPPLLLPIPTHTPSSS